MTSSYNANLAGFGHQSWKVHLVSTSARFSQALPFFSPKVSFLKHFNYTPFPTVLELDHRQGVEESKYCTSYYVSDSVHEDSQTLPSSQTSQGSLCSLHSLTFSLFNSSNAPSTVTRSNHDLDPTNLPTLTNSSTLQRLSWSPRVELDDDMHSLLSPTSSVCSTTSTIQFDKPIEETANAASESGMLVTGVQLCCVPRDDVVTTSTLPELETERRTLLQPHVKSF